MEQCISTCQNCWKHWTAWRFLSVIDLQHCWHRNSKVCASLAQERQAAVVLRDESLQRAEGEKLELEAQLNTMVEEHEQEVNLLKGELKVGTAGS